MQGMIEKLGLGEKTASLIVWIGLSVLLLIIVVALAAWLVRILRPSLNLSGGGGRSGRPQRLAVTDAFTLDRDGRKLVIVRRDNIEHLLLIGGPNDVLVESNIVRGERSVRGRSFGDDVAADMVADPVQSLPPAAPMAPAAPMPPAAPLAPMAPPTPPPRMAPPPQPLVPSPPSRPPGNWMMNSSAL